MTIEILLYILLIIFGIVLIYLWNKSQSQKNEIKTLKKKLSNGMTDFEKLSFIVEIIKEVDFNKLRPDQVKLWDDFIKSLFH